MSIEAMLTAPEKALREEMQAFVQSVPRQLLLDMDADKVAYPREYLQEAARRNLLGLRFEPRWGGLLGNILRRILWRMFLKKDK